MSKSRRSGGSFGSNPSHHQKSRGELIRDRYSTDRYPTAEDFIRAVEQDPDHFDPSNEYFFPHDYGNRFKNTERDGVRGFSGTDLKTNRPNNSNWIADNPIDVDVDVDPGSLSLSTELWGDGENSVDVVAGVDLVPLGVDINVNGDVGTIGVELGAPGDLFGVEGEISFNTTTGEVIGGGAGIELGGVNVSVNRTSHKGKTCTTVTVTYFGVGASYQNCQKDDEEPPEPPPPNNDLEIPDPPPTPEIPGDPNDPVYFIADATAFYWAKWQNPETGFSGYEIIKGETFTNWTINHLSTTINGSLKRLIEGEQPENTNTSDIIYSSLNMFSPYGNDGSLPEAQPIPDSILASPNFRTGGTLYYTKTTISQANLWLQWQNDRITVITPNYSEGGWARAKLTYYRNLKTNEEGPEEPDPPKQPDPPIPPIPPSEEDMGCCDLEPVMSMLRKMNKALAVDEVVDQGLQLPNEWILPTGKGHTKMNNYLQIAVFLAKMQDHLGVHPLTVQIADLNAGQEGNQEFKKYYPNGTKAIQEILTILHDENSDSADRLNLQMRLAILNTRIFVTVASIARSLRGVFQFLGAPLKEKRDVVPLPFDYTYGLRKNKGFSQNAAQDGKLLEEAMTKLEAELNKNTETATEALLAKFLNDSDQPIIFETFDNNNPDLLELLRAVNSNLKKSK